jgi:hypothetical protein
MNTASQGSPIGDVLRAWELLDASSSETRAAIAELLGFDLSSRTGSSAVNLPTTGEVRVPLPGPLPPPPPQPSKGVRREILVETLPQRPEESRNAVLGNEALFLPSSVPPLPPKLPLLNPQWVRALLSNLLSLTIPGNQLDLPRLVRDFSSGAPMRRIPWRSMSTMSAGVRCFIDAGPPLDVLADDTWEVLRNLRLLAGFERVAIKYFQTVPDAPDSRYDAESEGAAAPDSPVLILSDFGHYPATGRRWALIREWLAWIERERARGTTLIVGMTPLDPANWPSSLARDIQLVEWDVHTGVRPSVRRYAF